MTRAVEVTAQMVASVVRVVRSDGDLVRRGDTLLVVETMKMEIPVTAPEGGRLRTVAVAQGDVISEGDVIAVIDTDGWGRE